VLEGGVANSPAVKGDPADTVTLVMATVLLKARPSVEPVVVGKSSPCRVTEKLCPTNGEEVLGMTVIVAPMLA
jgi:hypothetical protein